MKKLYILIFLLLPFFAHGQNYHTPAIPPKTASFTPSFRVDTNHLITDSLKTTYLANGNKYYPLLTWVQANANFLQSAGSLGTNNYGAFYNNTTGKYYFTTFFGFDGSEFTMNKPLFYGGTHTYSTGNPRLVLEGGNKIGLDTTLDAGPVPTNGTQLITPDSIGLGGRLSHYTGIGFRQYGLYLGDDSLSTTYVNIDPGNGTIRLNVQDTVAQSANIMYSTGQTLSTSTSVSHRENYLQIDTSEVDLISIDGLEHGYQLRLTQSDSTATFTDDLRHKGIEYTEDYSAQFTDNSLISRKASIMIADSVFTGGIGGALLNGATNTLTAPTIINTGASTVFEVNGGTGSGNESSLIVAPSASALNNQVSSTVGYGVSVVTSGPFTGANLGYENPSNSADISNIQVDENNMYIKDTHKKVGLLNNAAMNFVGGEQLMSYRQLDSLKSTWGFSPAIDTTLLARKIGSADMVQHSYTGYTQTINNPSGQAYTVYHNGTSINGISGSVGALANKEINVSWNMKYDVPGKENTHQPIDSTSNSIWTGQGSNYFMLQYAKALGVPQTGVGNITILTGGTGFTDGSYNLLATGGSGTAERLIFTVSGGVVVSAAAAHQGFNYAVNDHLSCAGFAGFTVNVNTLFNDIWNSTGQMNFMKMDVASGSIMLASPTTVAFPAQGATLEIPHSTIYSNASISGIGDGRGLILAGNNDVSVTTPEDVQINPATAGGNTGGATLIDAGGGYVGVGSNTKQTNVKLGIAGTQAASGTTGEAIRSRTQLIPTANGQVLAQVLVDPPADAVGTGALTATITTAATSLADGTYDNLASTSTPGSGQTWKVTVLGGNVTAIVPATAATGGTGYAVGNTFTVSTVTGAVFTVASLGYTGLIDIGLEVNAFPLLLPNITAPTTTKFGTVYNTGNILKTVTNAAGVERVMIQTDATGTSAQIPVYNSNGFLTPTTVTGSGAPVEATSPTLITPTLGVASATSIAITGTRIGSTTLVAGTSAISITGVTTSSKAFVTRTVATGTSLTTGITAVCTSGTLTITADVAAGTINTADTSTYNYFVIN